MILATYQYHGIKFCITTQLNSFKKKIKLHSNNNNKNTILTYSIVSEQLNSELKTSTEHSMLSPIED
jgi:hypothetical protein